MNDRRWWLINPAALPSDAQPMPDGVEQLGQALAYGYERALDCGEALWVVGAYLGRQGWEATTLVEVQGAEAIARASQGGAGRVYDDHDDVYRIATGLIRQAERRHGYHAIAQWDERG
jgi:hypothetical protein